MLICSPYPGVSIYRKKKSIYAKFCLPHIVLSTCRVNGGIKEDIKIVANHQICEPSSDHKEFKRLSIATKNPFSYHKLICKEYDFDPEKTVLLGTAANMNSSGFSLHTFDDLFVFSVVTGGVEANAVRAGDKASWHEENGTYKKVGTINIMLFINQTLTQSALIEASIVATEAKSSILQELNIPSKSSSGIATGTGTDQIAVSSLKESKNTISFASKHLKIGELIAKATRDALRVALSLQNKILPETIRYIPKILERFGLLEDELLKRIKNCLSERDYELFFGSRESIFSDSCLLSHTLAYIHLMDQIAWKVVPKEAKICSLIPQASLVACAMSQDYTLYEKFFRYLQDEFKNTIAPLDLLVKAICEGFKIKWKENG